MKANRKNTPADGHFVPNLSGIQIFALIFTAIFLLHAPLLRLPYFWDEAGYYIPAAYDCLLHGDLIPRSVPSNAHPPVATLYLALWWKISGFKPAVTRIAMLLLAALGLTAVFSISRRLANSRVALATIACTAVYPVWFAQSSLAHADLSAAAFALWGINFYFRALLGRRGPDEAAGLAIVTRDRAHEQAVRRRIDSILSAIFFAIAALCKETAVVFPFTLGLYDLLATQRQPNQRSSREWVRAVLLFCAVLPLALWFAYHYRRTGYIFGNPQFFAYNVSGTMTPLRILLALGLRLWQLLGYMNLWLLTVATIWLMRYPALRETNGAERPRIALAAQYRIAALLVANVVLFSFIGGAALARYLLAVYPLVILIGISTVRRRLPEWNWAVAVILAGFAVALFASPIGYIPPEDNLSYRRYVIVHKEAANYLQAHDPKARVLTAWTATDELTKPFLGYVKQPMSVVRVEDFSYSQLQLARIAEGDYDYALLFSTKQEPSVSLLDRWPWWERMSRKYFGFHRDPSPEAAAEILGGRIVWERRMGQQWAAIVGFDRVQNALEEQEESGLSSKQRSCKASGKRLRRSPTRTSRLDTSTERCGGGDQIVCVNPGLA